jgi:quercetin dioxygenase-like cupin family protein
VERLIGKRCNTAGLRIRKVQYSENYKADHWCSLGHILYCLEGELVSELADGRSFILNAGMSYQVSDGASSHRSISKQGATLLIIDGSFLKNDKEAILNPWKM